MTPIKKITDHVTPLLHDDSKIQRCQACGEWAYDFELCKACVRLAMGGKR